MEENKSRVYVLADDKGRVTQLEGEYTLPENLDGWTLIEEGDPCDRLNLAQSHYLPTGLYTEDGLYRYKLVDGEVVERSEEELTADRDAMPKPTVVPTAVELAAENKALSAKLEAAIEANANLEECLVEMAEIVYA